MMEALLAVDWRFCCGVWAVFFVLGFCSWVVAHFAVRLLISKFVPWNL